MNRNAFTRIRQAGLLTGIALLAGACQHMGNYDLPARSIPRPAGTEHEVAFRMQAAKAEAEDFVLYLHLWTPGQVSLGEKGQTRLRQIAARLDQEPYPVVIQPSGDARLDADRAGAVAEYLLLSGIYEPEALVVVEEPELAPMFFIENEDILEDSGVVISGPAGS